MMITYEEAERLLNIPKYIVIDEDVKQKFDIIQEYPLLMRIELVSEDDDEYSFLWQIEQSSKDMLRISLHFQENDSKIGLFRVDYNGGHHNPSQAIATLPDKFKPYIGKWFANNESHVHYYVEGYKPLAWALPIEVTDFSPKEINSGNLIQNFNAAIMEFARIINLQTQLTIQPLLL